MCFKSAAKLPSSLSLPLYHITRPFTGQVTQLKIPPRGLPHQLLVHLLHPHLPQLAQYQFAHHAILGTLPEDRMHHLITGLARGHLIVDHFQVCPVGDLIRLPVRTLVQPHQHLIGYFQRLGLLFQVSDRESARVHHRVVHHVVWSQGGLSGLIVQFLHVQEQLVRAFGLAERVTPGEDVDGRGEGRGVGRQVPFPARVQLLHPR
mmetsp:Transcript_5509/g.10760  ORF Transcript_5509/g.10760 Transcript_5509/m.10760 type:complete len:205 (+) Transcript_5509:132-746(+)